MLLSPIIEGLSSKRRHDQLERGELAFSLCLLEEDFCWLESLEIVDLQHLPIR